MRGIMFEDGDISLEARDVVTAVSDVGNDETDDLDLADICDVVISLKCKQCEFICTDKASLGAHIKQVHRQKPVTGGESVQPGTGNETPEAGSRKGSKNRETENEKSEGCSTAAKRPKKKKEICWKVEVAEGEQTNESASDTLLRPDNIDLLIPVESILDESVEHVFLCAECDIVFSSRDMCCSHMHEVHGLQFTADFIQKEIISNGPEESQSSEDGTKVPPLIPKKYRVTKCYVCSKCSLKFESRKVLKVHERCHVPLVAAEELQDEASSKSETGSQKGFACPICDDNDAEPQLFSYWAPCSWHLWKEHGIDCELYTCTICKEYKSHLIARVKDHELLHSSDFKFKCGTCNKPFKQNKQLRNHEKYHKSNDTKHTPYGDNRWYTPKECPICKRTLSDAKCLKKHISAVHNKLKPYICKICGHTTARKAELKLHLRQHTGEKPYTCPMCPFQTGDHNSLRKHKLRHGDQRPYACPYCDYRCIQSCAFKKHILSYHPGQEVVFICQICSHASVNEAMFAVHQKEHTETRVHRDSQKSSEMANKETPSPAMSYDSNANGCDWSEEDDDLDVIDNGGVTIVEDATTLASQDTRGSKEHTASNGKEAVSSKSRPTSATKKTMKGVMELLNKISTQQDTTQRSSEHRAVSEGPYGNGSSSVLSPPVAKATTNGVVSHCEDTESSTSEAISSPHQFIQNIQLTPLDMTGIISCNEQSNDDGMLQRLLDMSGV